MLEIYHSSLEPSICIFWFALLTNISSHFHFCLFNGVLFVSLTERLMALAPAWNDVGAQFSILCFVSELRLVKSLMLSEWH